MLKYLNKHERKLYKIRNGYGLDQAILAWTIYLAFLALLIKILITTIKNHSWIIAGLVLILLIYQVFIVPFKSTKIKTEVENFFYKKKFR